MSQQFGDLEGVETDIDDILLHGTTEEEHGKRLEAALQGCEEINLTLNKNKCEFKVTEVTYVGHRLTKERIKPDEEKVKAIKNMPAPTDKKGVERFIGTVNYLERLFQTLQQ